MRAVVRAWTYARRLPPRSRHQAHHVEVERLISGQGRRSCLNAQAVPVPDLLRALLTASGISGHEEEPARIWREAASSFAEVTSDTLGSSFARVRAGEGAPTLALVGHIDEIGIAITNVEESGLLSFTTVGGIAPETVGGAVGAGANALVTGSALFRDPEGLEHAVTDIRDRAHAAR